MGSTLGRRIQMDRWDQGEKKSQDHNTHLGGVMAGFKTNQKTH